MKIILLSGGSGKRLWPLSNDVRSKQFIKIFKTENGYESMLQRVYRQIRKVDKASDIVVTTSKSQLSAIRNQLGDKVDICVEPTRRDTFPAIVLAGEHLHEYSNIDEDEVIVVCPVDSYVEDSFYEKIVSVAENVNNIPEDGMVLLGVKPTFPTEKYGYIVPDADDTTGDKTTADNTLTVSAYIEKPSLEKARELIANGALWSAGVFAFRLGYLLNKAHKLIDYTDFDDLYGKYSKLKKNSFDYEITENEKNLKVVTYNGQWKDLGTWNTMSEAMESPVIGKAIISDTCENVRVLNDMDVPVLCMGLHDVIITTSPEGILVTDKEESARIKPYVDKVRQQVRIAEKSWGEFRVMDVEEDSLTVKVTLNEGHSMNYHSHQHRDEMWTVISGHGRTIVDGMEQPVKAGDVITMQAGCKHTIIADTELKLIEIQLGKNISVHDKQKFELE